MVITMMKKIEEMRSSMMEAGVYSIEDIEEICRLESEYAQECEEIADQCAEEGYPSLCSGITGNRMQVPESAAIPFYSRQRLPASEYTPVYYTENAAVSATVVH